MNEQFDQTPPTQDSTLEQQELLHETTAYINAGGRGTRLAKLLEQATGETDSLPHSEARGITKSLITIGDEAIIDYHVRQLTALGFHNIIIGAGDHDNIREHFESSEKDQTNVEVVVTKEQEGTGGDLIKAVRERSDIGKFILIQNSDTLIEADLADILKVHNEKQAGATIVVTERKNVPNENAFSIDSKGQVIYTKEAKVQNKPEPDDQSVAYRASSTGLVIINSDIIGNYDWQPGDGSLSLYSEILAKVAEDNRLYAHNIGENFFVDIGTEKNYKKIRRHPIITQILEQRNLKKE